LYIFTGNIQDKYTDDYIFTNNKNILIYIFTNNIQTVGDTENNNILIYIFTNNIHTVGDTDNNNILIYIFTNNIQNRTAYIEYTIYTIKISF